MSQASDFPITFGYHATDGVFYGPHGSVGLYHRGADRAMPIGTPVIVNGVQIGLSGNSGASSGPHLHIGRFLGALDTDPGAGGFSFNSAVVTQVSGDPTNGNFVRVQADGASWVYLHLLQQTCSAGQVLKPGSPASTNQQGADEMIATADQATKIYRMLRPSGDISPDEINNTAGKRSFAEFLNSAQSEVESRNANLADLATKARLWQNASTQLAAQQTTIDTLHAQVEALSADNTKLMQQINDDQAIINTPKTAPEVPVQPNWFIKFLSRFIKK